MKTDDFCQGGQCNVSSTDDDDIVLGGLEKVRGILDVLLHDNEIPRHARNALWAAADTLDGRLSCAEGLQKAVGILHMCQRADDIPRPAHSAIWAATDLLHAVESAALRNRERNRSRSARDALKVAGALQ